MNTAIDTKTVVGFIGNMSDFQREVVRLRKAGWNDSNYLARQIVDDYYRHTKVSLHGVQNIIEALVIGLPSFEAKNWCAKALAVDTLHPNARSGVEALLQLLEKF